MGLIATMRPTKKAPEGVYTWGRLGCLGCPRKVPKVRFKPFDFSVTVTAQGSAVASAVFRRKLSDDPIRFQNVPLKKNGFWADYFAPSGSGRHPAILAFGGSEGGQLSYYPAQLLAAHGYPTLALAYFKWPPGLPKTLSRIPLEYFAKALTWLSKQPEVDPNRIITLGISRGSEAALLLGVHYPQLVHGVIASVPSNVSNCNEACDGPTWTLGGKALPYTRQDNNPQPTDDPAAIIPVEQIRGPLFVNCAGQDEAWESCTYAKAISKRLKQNHHAYKDVLYIAPKAGHFAGSFVPSWPGWTATDTSYLASESEQARQRQWPHLLTYLANLKRSP